MPLSYTEEIASEYFRHIETPDGRPKYLVSEKVKYLEPRETAKKVRGWHDIDVLAIGTEEVCIVETKMSTIGGGRTTQDEKAKGIADSFRKAELFVKSQYTEHVEGKTVRKIFVADYTTSPFEERLKAQGIETLRLKDVVASLLKLLKERTKRRLGREESNVTRTLIHLLGAGLVKEDALEE